MKMKWRRRREALPHAEETELRKQMLGAKRAAEVSRKKDKRRAERGSWKWITELRSGERSRAMWAKIKPRRDDGTDEGKLHMIEAGVRMVAQVGFPHDVEESERWAADMDREPLAGGTLSDEVLQDPELWKVKWNKAMGEDGWCDEMILLLRILGGAPKEDLDTMMRLVYKHAVVPRYQRGALIKPVLKPGKKGEEHRNSE